MANDEQKPPSPDALTATLTLITKAESAGPRKTDKLEILKLVIEFVKVLAWPVLLAGLLVWFRHPLGTIMDQLPDKFSRASKVSLGNVTLEIIQEKARRAGLPDVAEKLGKLSAEAVEALLNIGKNTVHHIVGSDERQRDLLYTLPREGEMRTLLELRERGFLEFTEDYSNFLTFMNSLPMREDLADGGDRRVFRATGKLAPAQSERLRNQSYRLTKHGEEALDSVIQAVTEQLAKREDAPE